MHLDLLSHRSHTLLLSLSASILQSSSTTLSSIVRPSLVLDCQSQELLSRESVIYYCQEVLHTRWSYYRHGDYNDRRVKTEQVINLRVLIRVAFDNSKDALANSIAQVSMAAEAVSRLMSLPIVDHFLFNCWQQFSDDSFLESITKSASHFNRSYT